MIEAQLLQDWRGGPHWRVTNTIRQLEHIRTSCQNVQSQRGLPGILPQSNRPANRFTHERYDTPAQELEAVTKWRMEEVKRNRVIRDEYPDLLPQEPTLDISQARDKLNLHLTTSNLMLKTVSRYPQRLRSEIQSDSRENSIPEDSGTELGSALSQSTLTNPETAQLSILGHLFIPYAALHYLFDDILGAFKATMFSLDRRAFPDLMDSENWNSMESVPVAVFIAKMRQHPDLKERFTFFKQELRSVAMIRHAHAHGDGDFDATQISELLVDASVAAEVLGFRLLSRRIAEYQPLIDDYGGAAALLRADVQRKTTTQLEKLSANMRSRQAELSQEGAQVQERLRQIQSQKNRIAGGF
jgi:hypothetical protein